MPTVLPARLVIDVASIVSGPVKVVI